MALCEGAAASIPKCNPTSQFLLLQPSNTTKNKKKLSQFQFHPSHSQSQSQSHLHHHHRLSHAASSPPPPHRLPLIRAQISSPDHVADANFYKVEAILRPWRVPQVSKALLKIGIRGVTISDVKGFGAQGGLTERQAGSEFSEDNFVAKVKMEIVVSKDQVEAVVEKIIDEARTGEIGDGKIFLIPVYDVIRVRTGERGEKAERMVGGRADMSEASRN